MGAETDDVGNWKSLGELLRRRRAELGLSRAKAAKAADISDTLWRHFEIGERQIGAGVSVPPNPRPETLTKIARALNLPVSALYEAIGWEAPPSAASEYPDGIADLAAKIRRLDPEARAVVNGVIDQMLKKPR